MPGDEFKVAVRTSSSVIYEVLPAIYQNIGPQPSLNISTGHWTYVRRKLLHNRHSCPQFFYKLPRS